MTTTKSKTAKAEQTFKMKAHQVFTAIGTVSAVYASNALGRVSTMNALEAPVPEGLAEWGAGGIGVAVVAGVIVYMTRPIPMKIVTTQPVGGIVQR